MPINLAIPQEGAVASYDWTELASGQGFVNYYPSIGKDKDFKFYPLLDQILDIYTTDGKLALNKYFKFSTSNFKFPRIIDGKAFLSGFMDYTSGAGLKISARLTKEKGTAVLGGASATTYEDLGGVTSSGGAGEYILLKTIEVEDYVNKVSYSLASSPDGFQAQGKIVILYYGDDTLESESGQVTSSTPTTINYNHANKNKKVWKVLFYGRKVFSGGTGATISNAIVTAEVLTGITEETLCDWVESATETADNYFLLEMILTNEQVSVSERLVLELKTEGGVGHFVLDPVGRFISDKATIKLNIPFKIDL